MDDAMRSYIEINKDLIQNYFVMKHRSGILCLYISTPKPLELRGDELIAEFARKQDELYVVTPPEYDEVAKIMGVPV